MSPCISVVIPTFRRPALLVEAVASALDQDGVAVEVLVLDDSPECSAREAVASMADPRVTYRPMAVPSGGRPALVRNEGWRLARAPYLHFLDDDDRVAPGAYRAALEAFATYPKRGVVFGRVEPFGENPGDLEHERRVFARAARCARLYGRSGSRLLPFAHTYFTPTPLFVNSACLVRREVVGAVGGYDPDLPVCEDLDFYTRAMRASGYVFLDQVVLEYRIGAGSLMHAHRAGSDTVSAAARRSYAKYRAAHGLAEFLALKVVGKLVLRWL